MVCRTLSVQKLLGDLTLSEQQYKKQKATLQEKFERANAYD
jgi:hypothetical protein